MFSALRQHLNNGQITTCVCVLLIACFCTQHVYCQCTDRISDGVGYQNVKELASANGFLAWNLVYGDSTANGVGPTSGYDGGGENDCYFLTSGGTTGDRAFLLSPCYAQLTDPIEVNFAYYLFGENAGNLSVYLQVGCVKSDDLVLPKADDATIFTKSGSQSDQWQLGLGSVYRGVPTEYIPFQIIFEATVKGETNNTIAVDSISVNNAVDFTTTIMSYSQPTTQATAPQQSSIEVMTSSGSTDEQVTIATARAPGESTPSPDMSTIGTTTLTPSSVSLATLANMYNTRAAGLNGSSEEPTLESNTTARPTTWCDENEVVPGLDNCTFIGLMFAAVPLGFVFLLWLVCYTYNRYCTCCKKPEEPVDRYAYQGDSSMAKDQFASTSVGTCYGNYTDSSFAASVPPSTNTAVGNTGGIGATTAAEENHELAIFPESKEEDCLVDIGDDADKKTPTPVVENEYEHSIRRNNPSDKSTDDVADGYDIIAQGGGNGMNGAAVQVADDTIAQGNEGGMNGAEEQIPATLHVSSDSEDPSYAVLNGPGSPDDSAIPPSYAVLNGPGSPDSANPPSYAVLNGPGSPDDSAIPPSYAVLNGPGSPDDSPSPPKRTTSVMTQPSNKTKHDVEIPDYETLRENNPSPSSASPPISGQHNGGGWVDNSAYATLLDDTYDTLVGVDGSEDTKL